MPLIVWGALGVAGLVGLGWTAEKVDGALEEGADLAKWLTVMGMVYLAYQVHKSGGFLK